MNSFWMLFNTGNSSFLGFPVIDNSGKKYLKSYETFNYEAEEVPLVVIN